MLLYAITQRSAFPGNSKKQTSALIKQVRELAAGGVHYLQIREKDLSPSALHALATSIVAALRESQSPMKILLNGPYEIAFRTGCDGIHLPASTPLTAARTALELYRQAGRTCILSAACHTPAQIIELRKKIDLLLFSPIFEKVTPTRTIPGVGLSALSQAIRIAQQTPVIALGGVTAQNAHLCETVGAKGIAAIRLFLSDEWRSIANRETN
jgi:thiamine-phosphate pyrophosphorylase